MGTDMIDKIRELQDRVKRLESKKDQLQGQLNMEAESVRKALEEVKSIGVVDIESAVKVRDALEEQAKQISVEIEKDIQILERTLNEQC